MAENAVRAGDLAAAERWLEDCDPRPEDLTLDSVYRLARARLTEKRDDPGETLALLGERHDEVPFDDFHVAMAAVMRIDALHSLGRVQDAILELGWLDREHRSDWRVIRLHNPHACEPVLKLMVQARRQMTASFLLSGVAAMAVGVVLAWTAHWLAGLAAAGMTWIVLFMVLAGLTSPQPASRRMSAGVGASAVVSAGVGYWFGQDGWGYGLLASTVALVVLGFAALLVLAPGKE
jgi:hypothetical protein